VEKNISTKKPQLWSRGAAFLRESLRDHDIDYTTGRIGRALGLLAIPMMLEMSSEFSVSAFRCRLSALSSRKRLTVRATQQRRQ
jgi:hypothetical protein